MTAPVPTRSQPAAAVAVRNAQASTFPPHHDDQTFPSVLVVGTLASATALAGVWLTAILIA